MGSRRIGKPNGLLIRRRKTMQVRCLPPQPICSLKSFKVSFENRASGLGGNFQDAPAEKLAQNYQSEYRLIEGGLEPHSN